MEIQEQNGANGRSTTDRLMTGLGWFSIGLGLAEVLAPERLSELIGLDNGDSSLLRFYGLREIVAGVGILSQSQPVGWVWGRVAGDMLDLATLGAKLTSDEHDRPRVAVATAAVLGVTVLDLICAQRLSERPAAEKTRKAHQHVTKTITVNRAADEVYRFWRNLENLPRFMSNLESVQVVDERRSRWAASGPAGKRFAWEAEITDDQPGSRISWCSVRGSDVHNHGTVRFETAPGGRGTVVTVELEYEPPAGVVGAAIAKAMGSEPGQEIAQDLRHFKQIMETGEVTHSDASIHRRMHAAQPPVSWSPA